MECMRRVHSTIADFICETDGAFSIILHGDSTAQKSISVFLSANEVAQLTAWMVPKNNHTPKLISVKDGHVIFSILPCGEKEICFCRNSFVSTNVCQGRVRIEYVSSVKDVHIVATDSLHRIRASLNSAESAPPQKTNCSSGTQ